MPADTRTSQTEPVKGEEKITVRFHHGLGDCCQFASMIPLWLRRGWQVAVDCHPDKQPIFLAAGATIGGATTDHHGWSHPPRPGPPALREPWGGNKAGWNLTSRPMPKIGSWEELWHEFIDTELTLEPLVTEKDRDIVDDFLADLPRPLILLHSRGNTCVESKNLTSAQEGDIYRHILDNFEGTLVLVDFDNRVSPCYHPRVRHVGNDLKAKLSVTELWYLIQSADLFVGIDSGPLHLCRTTNTPAIGLWHEHYPSHFALPRPETLHLVTASHRFSAWNKYRRHDYCIAEVPDLGGQYVAAAAAQLLAAGGKAWWVVWDSIARRCNGLTAISAYNSRHGSLVATAERLAAVAAPVIVQLGVKEGSDNYSGGMAETLWSLWVYWSGGEFLCCDNYEGWVDDAERWIPWGDFYRQQPVQFVAGWNRRYDLLYLDTDGDTLAEVQAAVEKMADNGLILIDDCVWSPDGWRGRGTAAVPWLLNRGWRVAYCGYQTLLERAK